jgi:hypothetical protein
VVIMAVGVLVGRSATANIDAGSWLSHDIRKSNEEVGRPCGRNMRTRMREDLAGRQTHSLSELDAVSAGTSREDRRAGTIFPSGPASATKQTVRIRSGRMTESRRCEHG